MKRMNVLKVPLLLLPLSILTSCAALSDEIASLKRLLTDVSASADAALDDVSDSQAPVGETKECRGKPPHEACKADGTKFCADLVPTPPEAGSRPPSRASFESRRDGMHEFMDCLKDHESELTAECLNVVQNPPPRPESRGVAAKPKPHNGKGGQRPPPPCGGSTEMAACRADARTYCATELLTPDEVPTLSREEMHDRADAILACLNEHAAQLTAECTTAIASRSNSNESQN